MDTIRSFGRTIKGLKLSARAMFRIVLVLITLFLWPPEILADHVVGHISPPVPYIGMPSWEYQQRRDLYERQQTLDKLQHQNDLIQEQQRQWEQQREWDRQNQESQRFWRQLDELNRWNLEQLERRR